MFSKRNSLPFTVNSSLYLQNYHLRQVDYSQRPFVSELKKTSTTVIFCGPAVFFLFNKSRDGDESPARVVYVRLQISFFCGTAIDVRSFFFFTQHSLPNFGCVDNNSCYIVDRTWTTGFQRFCLFAFSVF